MLDRALQRQPDDRFQSAGELALELKRIAGSMQQDLEADLGRMVVSGQDTLDAARRPESGSGELSAAGSAPRADSTLPLMKKLAPSDTNTVNGAPPFPRAAKVKEPELSGAGTEPGRPPFSQAPETKTQEPSASETEPGRPPFLRATNRAANSDPAQRAFRRLPGDPDDE